jgi:prepilin-type N-terminal cleavage/methylation domain-containing protein/prepilin-type processing-associated H-X9-DG protein
MKFQVSMMKRCGFTLVELLVVLAVIVLLASISLTVFSRVREKGRQSVCSSNLRQMDVAIRQYIQDNDENYPSAFHYNDPSPQGLFPNRQVVWCPSSDYQSGKFLENDSYRYNVILLNSLKPGRLFHGQHEARFIESSQLIVLYDLPIRNWPGYYEPSLEVPGCLTSITNADVARNLELELQSFLPYGLVHSGGSNYLFADGHVKWLKPQAAAVLQCDVARNVPPES